MYGLEDEDWPDSATNRAFVFSGAILSDGWSDSYNCTVGLASVAPVLVTLVMVAPPSALAGSKPYAAV